MTPRTSSLPMLTMSSTPSIRLRLPEGINGDMDASDVCVLSGSVHQHDL